MVKDPAAVVDSSVKILTAAGRKISRVRMMPEGKPVEFSVEGDYTKIKLPVFKGYALISLEE